MHSAKPQSEREHQVSSQIPTVPLTLEGSSVLHQMLRFDWSRWRSLSLGERNRVTDEASAVLLKFESGGDGAAFAIAQ